MNKLTSTMIDASHKGHIHATGKKITLDISEWNQLRSIAHIYETAFKQMKLAMVDLGD